jgi:hypothetical protein
MEDDLMVHGVFIILSSKIGLTQYLKILNAQVT